MEKGELFQKTLPMLRLGVSLPLIGQGAEFQYALQSSPASSLRWWNTAEIINRPSSLPGSALPAPCDDGTLLRSGAALLLTGKVQKHMLCCYIHFPLLFAVPFYFQEKMQKCRRRKCRDADSATKVTLLGLSLLDAFLPLRGESAEVQTILPN
jgi:hypothetical protein